MLRIAVTLILLAAGLLAPAAALAAPYRVNSCRIPSGAVGAPAPADGWSFQVAGSGKPTVDDCAAGGSLRGSFDNRVNHGHATSVALRFDAPADTTITGYTIDRGVRLARAGDDSWRFNYAFLRDELAFRGTNQADICQPSRNGCSSRDGLFTESGLALRRFYMFIDCNTNAGSTDSRCFAGDWTTALEVRNAVITLDDGAPPVFSGTPSGALLDPSTPVKGVAEATFSATDRGSGLRDATLLIDGQAVASRPVDAAGSTCEEPYARTVPCPLESRGRLSFDTATLPDGPHEVALRLTDATGANQTTSGPFRITTANTPPPPPPPPAPPVPPPACLERPSLKLSASLARSTVAFGARATYSGRVLDPGGRAASGVPVTVRAGAAADAIATATSGATGRFSVRIPRGPSRVLRASAVVPGGLACSPARRLSVRAGATLKSSRRRAGLGQLIRFTGRVRGGVPRGGKLLVLQARDVDGRWRPVRTVRTNGAGRYRTSYRFRSSRGRFTYRFRVQVPRERGFDYALGYSPSRPVTVRGR